MLDLLSRIDPVLSGWTLWEGGATIDEWLAWAEAGGQEPAPIRGVPIEDARRNMSTLVETQVQRDDWGAPQPDLGYSVTASNKYNLTPRSVRVSVSAGSKFVQNWWHVDFGELGPMPPDPSIITYPIMNGVLRAMSSIWPTPWAIVSGTASESESRPNTSLGFRSQTTVTTFFHQITRMGYLSADRAAGFEPPTELICERLADGGLLMISSTERPDPANADQMHRCDMLTKIMDRFYPDEWHKPIHRYPVERL